MIWETTDARSNLFSARPLSAYHLYSENLLLWIAVPPLKTRHVCYTLVVIITHKFKIRRIPHKRWGCTALFPFPTSAIIIIIYPSARGYSSSPSNWSYSAQSFSIIKSISSCPLTCIGRITLILPLEFSIWVTLKCHKRCKGVFSCKLLIVRGFVGAHVHLVQVTRAFSVV